MKKLLTFLVLILMSQINAQLPYNYNKSTLNPVAFVNSVEQSLNLFYNDYVNDKRYDSIINALKYEPNEAPTFSDEIYCQRLEKINQMSTFPMDCNPITLSTIRFFASKRRSFARIVLGRSALYFDMFREKLNDYGMPEELRFLAVIESGLRPQVKSRAGALGLWQFMYRTGLQFGLEENNYIDDRMDPEKATEAACKFLKKLYGIYGDWNLALAAYNAGPGNVNKAIKRSGNKKTYWEIRPYLPTETQGYVPNFIAAAYLLTYHAEHNIIPMEAKIHYIHLDTVCLRDAVHMNTISKLLDWDLSEIKELNPVYKTTFIPKSEKGRCISGPNQLISSLAGIEDSLYRLEKSIYSPVIIPPQIVQNPIVKDTTNSEVGSPSTTDSLAPVLPVYLNYHKVKSQENLKNIALKYNVTVENIMDWNTLRTTSIYVGQKLKIYTAEQIQVDLSPKVNTVPVATKKYYNVRSGDTFVKISQRHNMTMDQLKKINPGININRLTVGQKIRVK